MGEAAARPSRGPLLAQEQEEGLHGVDEANRDEEIINYIDLFISDIDLLYVCILSVLYMI